jgi:iron complex transport system ATP-binding protein
MSIELRDIAVGMRGQQILSSFSLRADTGSCVGVVGPNGSGKSTAMKVLAGLLQPAAGFVAVEGRAINAWSRQELARHIAYLPQNGEVHWPLKVRAVVALGRLPHAPFGAARALDETSIEEAMARCDVTPLAHRPVNSLSGGERARVLLARALATGARIILADEPFAQLDPHHQIHAMEVLKAEAARGTTVVVVLHDLGLAARYCDRVAVVSGGTVAAEGSPRTVLSSDVLRNVFGVDAFIGEHQGSPLVLPIRRRADAVVSRGSQPHPG